MTSCQAKNKGEKVTLTVAIQDSFATSSQRHDAVQRTMSILTKRVYAITGSDPVIAYDSTVGNISILFYDTVYTSRVQHCIETAGRLQFLETFKCVDIVPSMLKANDLLVMTMQYGVTDTAADKDQEPMARMKRKFPLLSKLLISIDKEGMIPDRAYIGHVKPEDTATVNAYLGEEKIKRLFPVDARFLYGFDEQDIRPAMFAVKDPANEQSISNVSAAVVTHKNYSRYPILKLEMMPADAKKWQEMTARNVGKYIAIVMDGIVWCCPKVETEIRGGHTEITAQHYTEAEAQDLATMLKYGQLPLSLRVMSCKKGN